VARSYLLDPTDTVRVVIFIDTRNGISVYQHKDVYDKIVAGGQSNLTQFDDQTVLPEGVFKETAEFSRPSFSLQQEIEQDSLIIEGTGDEAVYRVNMLKRSELTFKYLLTSWSLDASDKNMKLVTVKDGKGRTHLNPNSLKMIMNLVHPSIVQGLLTAYNWHDRKKLEETEEKAQQEAVAATGLDAKN
jgi:hypothetical protein